MAKKKKKKEDTSKTFRYSIELNGLLLILIGVIGIGAFGPVGRFIKNFSIFLMGSWYILVLVSVFLIGIYMLLKRKIPKFISNRLVGIYFLIVAILMFSHLNYAVNNELQGKAILQTTIDNFMGSMNSNNPIVGGGIIGSLFIVLFTSLFDVIGSKIIIIIFSIFGFILLFDITFADIWQRFTEAMAKHKEKRKERLAAAEEEPEYDEDEEYEVAEKDVVVAAADELKLRSNSAMAIEENVSSEETNVDFSQPKVQTNSTYRLPSIDLLDNPVKQSKVNSNDFVRTNKLVLERVLGDFGIKGQVVDVHVGPTVTQYEVSVPHGTRVAKISGLNKEIALALAAKDVRIQAPIPGKSAVGIELPNPSTTAVKIKEVLTQVPKSQANAKLLVALGKDIMGRAQTCDIAKTPHLLVAGSTGSGKSVCINSFIISLLLRYRPDEVKLVLVDPKKVELSNYNGVPHLLCPVVTNPKKASAALQKIVAEMERRYDVFSETGVKNIGTYNDWVEEQNKQGNTIAKMTYMVVIIDELADLMMVASKEVEDSIMRITQMARAAGIHLIVATQRPSTDVITGVVKANIPSRIAFAVATGIDSRTILDQTGAEKLLGKGDMLFLPMGENAPIRIQGTFISDDEIKRVIDYVTAEQVASYDSFLTKEEDTHMAGANSEAEEYEDPLYNEIVEFAIQTGKISASLLQRRFRLGYNRAARIVDLLEERGVIGPQNGSKPREVLIKNEQTPSEE